MKSEIRACITEERSKVHRNNRPSDIAGKIIQVKCDYNSGDPPAGRSRARMGCFWRAELFANAIITTHNRGKTRVAPTRENGRELFGSFADR